ncbi:hypothetical protein AB6E95_02305 [Vibrio splendidus]|uniref:DUF3592 domain-containing protein n=1 Tax=Vibrio splendidus TaxID=29497 RepID=A0ABV4LNI5_VIBSP
MYEVVYNIKFEGLWSLCFALPGLLFIYISAEGYKNRKKLSSWDVQVVGKPATEQSIGMVFKILLIFSVLWTALSGGSLIIQLYSLLSDYGQGEYDVVEGSVENFNPMPYGGHQQESFTVEGVKFSYSDFSISPDFNNTKSHGGPIRKGLRVRVSHIDNVILKLEVMR